MLIAKCDGVRCDEVVDDYIFCESCLDSMKTDSYNEGFKDGRSEGYDDGYEKGRTDALAEVSGV